MEKDDAQTIIDSVNISMHEITDYNITNILTKQRNDENGKPIQAQRNISTSFARHDKR